MEQVTDLRQQPSLAPEHDWAAASRLIRPSLRPVGTPGDDGHDLKVPHGSAGPGHPLIGAGPAGLPIVYVIPASGFEVVVGIDHLLSWGVGPEEVHAAAMANLQTWSASAPWTEEVEGSRHIVWSDTGEGCDAARVLLADVRKQLSDDLSGEGRVMVAVPERDLLIAAALAEGDEDFAGLFAEYIADRSADSDEPIDPRIFEIVDGELVEMPVLASA